MQPTTSIQQSTISHRDPLLAKSGLTYSRAVSNLTQQVNDLRERNQKIYNTVAIVVGVAVTLAVVAGGIFNIRNPEVGIPLLLTGLLCIPGLIVGGLIWVMGWGISELTLISTIKTHEKFAEIFEDNACIENDDLATTLIKCNEAHQRSMIQDMNFEQLAIARHTLGKKKFGQLIKSVVKEPHHRWKDILKSYPKENPDAEAEIITNLRSPAIQRLIITSPLFARELRYHFRKCENPEILSILRPSPFSKQPINTITFKCDGEDSIQVDSELLKEKQQDFKQLLGGALLDSTEISIPKEKYKEFVELLNKLTNAKVTFSCEGKEPIQANRWLLEKRCGYFNSMFNNFNTIKSNTVQIPEEQYDEYRVLIDALTNDDFDWNVEQAVQLLPLADQFQNIQLLYFIENTLTTNRAELNEEDIESLLENYSASLPILTSIADDNQCKIKINDNNWNELNEKGEKCHLPELLKKCKNYALQQFENALSTNLDEKNLAAWLDKCIKIKSFNPTELAAQINGYNFKAFYTFAHKKNNLMLKDACSKYVKTHPLIFVNASFKNTRYKTIILNLDERDYKDFSTKLQSKIDLMSLANIFKFAQENEDEDVLHACLEYVKNNREDVIAKNVWELDETPEIVSVILFP